MELRVPNCQHQLDATNALMIDQAQFLTSREIGFLSDLRNGFSGGILLRIRKAIRNHVGKMALHTNLFAIAAYEKPSRHRVWDMRGFRNIL